MKAPQAGGARGAKRIAVSRRCARCIWTQMPLDFDGLDGWSCLSRRRHWIALPGGRQARGFGYQLTVRTRSGCWPLTSRMGSWREDERQAFRLVVRQDHELRRGGCAMTALATGVVATQTSWWPTRKWSAATIVAFGGFLATLATQSWDWTPQFSGAVITIATQRIVAYVVKNDDAPGGVRVRGKTAQP